MIIERGTKADGRKDTIVRVERTDGSSVWVSTTNEKRNPDHDTSAGQTPYPDGPPPLTTAQLVAIGLDPALTLYP